MKKYIFKISIVGSQSEATKKAEAVKTLASYLDEKTLSALANVVKTDPSKVALAKQFLGI